jgi:CubicO group peptidase (beta-lactamase class C family)
VSDLLAAVEGWPVPTASAALVGPEGVIATSGQIEHEFPLASVTKPLTALAILVAVEEEAVSLDDPADEDVVPGATLRHLLAHASGYATDRRMRAAGVGTRRIYSNVGIERAATLVAKAADMPFAQYLDESVFRPLRMTSTSLPGSAARDGVSTVTDLARVVHELLSPTGLLSAHTLADATSVQFPGLRGVLPGYGGQEHNDWGLGFEVRDHKSPHWTGRRNDPSTFGHFGQSGTMLWVDPVARLGLVALADRDFGPWAAAAWPELADTVLGGQR